MQVSIDQEYPVAAGLEAAWAVLSNMHELASCMPGAQITEELDPAHFMGSVRVKVGPAVAAFTGSIVVLQLDPTTRTLKLMGKGADKGGSTASMELSATLVAAELGNSTLQGRAKVIVNGKFAQFGGRMMGSVSDTILAQFAEVFSQKAQAWQGATQAVASAAAPVVAREINALGLLWTMLRNFFAGLFGRHKS